MAWSTATGPATSSGSVAAGTEGPDLLDSGCDDSAVWAEVWGQGHHLVCRLQHRDRRVRPAADAPTCPLATLAPQLGDLAAVAAELVVRKTGQERPNLQPVTATVAAAPLVVTYREDLRSRPDGAERTRACWLVEVRLAKGRQEPWWLLTDRPVETAEQAIEVCRMSCQRWAIEDAFKVGRVCLGWEEVQGRADDAGRRLVALGWVAAGFLFDLGVPREWGEIRRRRRLGGGEDRPNRPPGKIVLTRGLRRLLDDLAMAAILADEVRRHGGRPPRIAALLGRSAAAS